MKTFYLNHNENQVVHMFDIIIEIFIESSLDLPLGSQTLRLRTHN